MTELQKQIEALRMARDAYQKAEDDLVRLIRAAIEFNVTTADEPTISA